MPAKQNCNAGTSREIPKDEVTVIEKDNFIGTIASWGPTFMVTLQLYINSFDTTAEAAEILRFTTTCGDCCNVGDRIPALWTHREGSIYFTTQIDENNNYYRHKSVKKKKNIWIKLIQQKDEDNDDKVRLTVIVDCVS